MDHFDPGHFPICTTKENFDDIVSSLVTRESCMKAAEINLEVPELRQGRVSEPQLGEGTQQSPPPFHS